MAHINDSNRRNRRKSSDNSTNSGNFTFVITGRKAIIVIMVMS